MIIFDGDGVDEGSGGAKDFGTAEVGAVEAGAEKEMMRVVAADGGGNYPEVARDEVTEKILLILIGGVGEFRVRPVAVAQPGGGGAAAGVAVGEGKVVGQGGAAEGQFVVGEMADEKGVVLDGVELAGVIVAEGFEGRSNTKMQSLG